MKLTWRSSLLAVALLSALALTACSNWDRTTYQTLAASKAVVDQASADYVAGHIPQTAQARQAIDAARQVQTAAVEAFKTYEMAKLAGKQATGLEQKRQQVIAILDQLPQVLDPVQKLIATAHGSGG